MSIFKVRFGILAAGTAGLLLLHATANAQDPVPPGPNPNQPTKRAQPLADPTKARAQQATGASFLERRHGLSREEAQRRLALENEVAETGAKIEESFGDSVLASIIDHEPNFQVTYVFSRDVAADEVRRLVTPELRPLVKVKRSRYTRDEISGRQRRVVAALTAAKVGGSVGYDYRTDKFEVTVSEEGEKSFLPFLPADLRSDVRVVRGGTPATLQTGAQPGDAIYGGWMVHRLSSTGAEAICTYGFHVRTHEGQSAITANSAEHCSGSIGIYYDDGHKVTLPTPAVVNKYIYNNTGRSYDYRVINTGTLGTGPYVWFWNNVQDSYDRWVYGTGWVRRSWANVNPNYPLEGAYSRVVGVVGGSTGTGNLNHPQGATRCKGGFKTGITCGKITLSDSAATRFLDDGSSQTFYGYVKFEGTDYMVFAYGGDSGGPVTTEPVWNANVGYYEVRAAGIMTMGSTRDRGDGYDRPCITPDDGACPAYYLPIDRINDTYPIQVITTVGGVSPN